MNLSLLILIPALTAIAILFCKDLKQVRGIALFGSVLELGATLFLMYAYWHERSAGNNAQMLFEDGYIWYAPLHAIFAPPIALKH